MSVELKLLTYWSCSGEVLVGWRMDGLAEPLEPAECWRWPGGKKNHSRSHRGFIKPENINTTSMVAVAMMIMTVPSFYRSNRTGPSLPSNSIGIGMHSLSRSKVCIHFRVALKGNLQGLLPNATASPYTSMHVLHFIYM